MKKIIISFFISVLFSPALAGPHHHHRPHHHPHWHQPHYNWVAPAIIGGVVGYAITRPSVVVVEQQPVAPICTEWREVQQADGTIIRERYCKQ